MGFFRRQKSEPGFAKDSYVIVGLGNPGKEYADTRHNMGYKAIDVLSSDENIEIRRNKFHSLIGQGRIAGKKVVLVKPEVFTDAKQIADHLISKKTVVLNLETASAENKRRIIDFLVGVAYANGGSLKPVANLTYIITPYNVGFIGEDLVNELETNGVIM